MKLGKIYPQSSQLLLQNTVFGFIASGSVGMENEAEYHCGLIRNEDLNETLTKFLETEECEVKFKKNKENEICEEHFARTHWRDEQKKYIVSMPFKDNPSYLGESEEIALKKLRSLLARKSKDKQHLSLIKNFKVNFKN